jgi:hypothetical protein
MSILPKREYVQVPVRGAPRLPGENFYLAMLGQLDLGEQALGGGLVGTPADEVGPVPKTIFGDMVVGDFDDQPGRERLPFRAAPRAPAAGSARRVAGESGRADELFQLARERGLILIREGGGEPDVMEQARAIVEPEQQGADELRVLAVTEAAHDTVDRSDILDLDHAVPRARAVGKVEALGHDAIEIASRAG